LRIGDAVGGGRDDGNGERWQLTTACIAFMLISPNLDQFKNFETWGIQNF